MYKLLVRNYSKQISPKYIPSKNKTWSYKKGYYQIPDKKNPDKKISHVSKNLNKSIINYYDNIYKNN